MKKIKEEKVFVNCPFDNDHFELLKAMLFAIIYLDKVPVIASTIDSYLTRINNLLDYISSAEYSIHDISPRPKKEIRLNMAFELGIAFGIRHSSKTKGKEKLLIMADKKHQYQQFISDISGNDIKVHNNKPKNIIKCVRDWFYSSKTKKICSNDIYDAFIVYNTDYKNDLLASRYTEDEIKNIGTIPFPEIIDTMKYWIKENKKKLQLNV
jgi:hypothetical protein